jgi:hypothetical protein
MSTNTLNSQIKEAKDDILRIFIELKNAKIKYLHLKNQLEIEETVGDSTPEIPPQPLKRFQERTKIKWILNDNTYRVAVVTRKCILQVKSVTDGILEVDKDSEYRKTLPKLIAFDNESLWRKSLPSGGKIYYEDGNNYGIYKEYK